MAYKYNNQTYVRADICPPCGSQSFTLKNGTLVCDTCGTVFNAATGAGISGACVKYAKQSVAFQTQNGNILMNGTDLNYCVPENDQSRKIIGGAVNGDGDTAGTKYFL